MTEKYPPILSCTLPIMRVACVAQSTRMTAKYPPILSCTLPALLKKFENQRRRLEVLASAGTLHVVVKKAEGLADMDKSVQAIVMPVRVLL